MKKRLVLALLLFVSVLSYSQERHLSFGIAVGYTPTNLSYIGLSRFDCFSIGVPLRLELGQSIFAMARPEAVVGTKNTKANLLVPVQFNLPSLSMPLCAGYSWALADFLALDVYAGAKLRYGGLSYTPTPTSVESLVVKSDYLDDKFKRFIAGACIGVNLSDLVHAAHSSFSIEWSKFFMPQGYDYSLSSLAINYTYWF